MAYVTKKELIDKIKPFLSELSAVREELESAFDRVSNLLEKIEEAVEEAEDKD